MIFRQFIHDDLGCGSYLVGDEDAGVAAVIDPKLDVEDYLAMASYMGVRIEHILETHNHADHVSGHGRLAAATGATIHINRLAEPDYLHEPFDDGWELELGCVTIRALHTPGHRPEHTAFALIDRARGLEPWAVLSGDTLFVGDIARPDLAVEKEEGAHGIFHSLHDTLLALPAECEVWPGHVGGSLCGGPGMDMKVSSTIAFERRHNRLLQLEDEDAFVRAATAQLRPQPPNFQEIVAINRGPLRTAGLDPAALATGDIERKQATGALLVDVRDDHAYDAAHIPGAVCNPAVRAGFGTKLAWVASRDQEIVLVGEGDADAAHAAQLAVAVGIDKVAGYLKGGMHDLACAVAADGLARENRRPDAVRAPRGAAGARRARAPGMGRGAHSRLDPHALPRCDRDPRGDRSGPAGGRDLRLRAAQRCGSVAAGAARRHPRGSRRRRRRGHLAAQRLAGNAGRDLRRGVTRVELPGSEIVGIRAANPGPFTLSGTNSWIVGRDPAWLVDPGPALDEHLAALAEEIERRGGLGGIVLTHDHVDHAEAVPAIRARFAGVPLAAARGDVDVRLADGSRVRAVRSGRDPGARARPPRIRRRRRGADGRCGARRGERVHRARPRRARLLPRRPGEAAPARAVGNRPGARPARWTIPRPSSTSTSRIAWTASGGWWRRWTRASGASTSCSTRSGTTRRRSCGWPRP